MDAKELAEQFKRSPTRNKGWIGILFCAMALILFLSYRSIQMILSVQSTHAPEDSHESAEEKMEEATESQGDLAHTVELKDVAVHLLSEDGKNMAYAQFTLVLDCPSKASMAKVEEARTLILNQIFDTANNYTVEELSTPQGKDAFKAELITEFTQSFGDLGPRNVLIQKWVMG